MISKFRLLVLLLLASLFIITSGCEKDMYENSIRTTHRGTKSELVSGREAQIIRARLEKSLKKRFFISNIHAARVSFDSIGTVKYDEIVKVTDSTGKSTYTFKVDRPDATLSKFYNLILQEKANGNIIKLMKYTMSTEFAQQFAQTENYKDFRGTLSTFTIVNETPCDDNDITLISIGTVGGNNNGGVGPIWNPGNPSNPDNPNPGNPNPGNPGGTNPGNPGSGNPPGGGSGNGGADASLTMAYVEMVIECIGGGGTWNYVDDNCIANPRYFKMGIAPVINPIEDQPCEPNIYFVVITPNTSCERSFLVGNQHLQWLYDHVATEEYAELMAFVNGDGSDCSQERMNVANELIREMKMGSKIDFVNKIIVDSTFVNNQKAMCVYNKMKNNQGFKTFTEPFNIDKPVAFVKLRTGEIGDNDRAETSRPDSNNIILITINNHPTHHNGINAQPNLFLCQTIIHEVIHAEFFRRIIEALGSNPSGQTLQEVIDALEDSQYQPLANYLIQSNVWPDWPHNYMAEKFRKAIARVTQEYATNSPVTGEPLSIYMSYAWKGLDQFDVQAWMNTDQTVRTAIQTAIVSYENNHMYETCQ